MAESQSQEAFNPDPLFDADRAARYLGLACLKHPAQAIRALCRKGRLRFIRLGDRVMVRRSWLEEYIESHTYGPRKGRKAGA